MAMKGVVHLGPNPFQTGLEEIWQQFARVRGLDFSSLLADLPNKTWLAMNTFATQSQELNGLLGQTFKKQKAG